MVRNQTLPDRVRAKAHLQLTQMHCYTRSTQIKNRCVMGGIARGVFRDFRMGRVSLKTRQAEIPRLRLPWTIIRRNQNNTDHRAVSIPYERSGWELARCEEGILVAERLTRYLYHYDFMHSDWRCHLWAKKAPRHRKSPCQVGGKHSRIWDEIFRPCFPAGRDFSFTSHAPTIPSSITAKAIARIGKACS